MGRNNFSPKEFLQTLNYYYLLYYAATNVWDAIATPVKTFTASTDVLIASLNVPEPTKPTHAVTKQYADSTAAMSMAMASAVDANSDGNHMGCGFGDYAGQTAMAVGVSLQYEKTKLKIIASQSETMKEPAFSGGFSWSF